MSSAVAETSSRVSSQAARAKPAPSDRGAANDGFSGLVDSNLNAAEAGDAPTDRPRPSGRDTSADAQASRHAGPRRQDQSGPARQTSADPRANASKTAAAADKENATKTCLTAETGAPGKIGAAAEDDGDDGDDTTAPEASTAPDVPATGIVAAAVTVQMELATEAPATHAPSEAITASTAAAPAEIAANALARVAQETADSTVEAGSQAEAGAPTATEASASQPNAGTAPQTTAEAQAEAAAPNGQLDAKARAESSATAEVDAKAATGEAEAEPAAGKAGDKPRQADAKKPQAQMPNGGDSRVEAHRQTADQPSHPDHIDAHAGQRGAHEQTAAFAADPSQPSGFGLTQTTAQPAQAVTARTAQLTAAPAAANVPVPVGGLAVEITANVQSGRSRFEIRLDPPELGRIDVRLDVDPKGQVTSHLVVEKSATLDLLRRDAPQLERALQDAGLKTSDNGLQFSLRDQQQQQAGRNEDSGSGRNPQRLVIGDEDVIAKETAGRSYGRMSGQRGGIDIRV